MENVFGENCCCGVSTLHVCQQSVCVCVCVCVLERECPETLLKPTEKSFNRTTQKLDVCFLTLGDTVENLNGGGQHGWLCWWQAVLEGKHSSRSKERVFLIEQLSRGSERTSVGLESYSPRLLEGRQSHQREAEGTAGLLGTEKRANMSWRRRGHHQQQENCRQKTSGSITWRQPCLKEHIKGH